MPIQWSTTAKNVRNSSKKASRKNISEREKLSMFSALSETQKIIQESEALRKKIHQIKKKSLKKGVRKKHHDLENY